MNIISKIVKETVLLPVRVIEGIVEAAEEVGSIVVDDKKK